MGWFGNSKPKQEVPRQKVYTIKISYGAEYFDDAVFGSYNNLEDAKKGLKIISKKWGEARNINGVICFGQFTLPASQIQYIKIEVERQ